MRIQSTDAPLGAEVTGVDVAQILDAENDAADWGAIHRAFAERKVLFFRDQSLKPDQLVKFARHFGPIGHYPFAEPLPDHPDVMAVIKEPHQTRNFGGLWHTDSPYLARPAAATVLYAVEVPTTGGDTIWSDMNAAYDALEPAQASRLADMRATQSAGKTNNTIRADALHGGTMTAAHETEMETLDAVHPVIRTHPLTGKRSLYVSPAHTTRINGLSAKDSDLLLNSLFEHATDERFICRFSWSVGTLAIWDNRSTLHYPLNDYHGQRREMLRVTIDGEVPV